MIYFFVRVSPKGAYTVGMVGMVGKWPKNNSFLGRNGRKITNSFPTKFFK